MMRQEVQGKLSHEEKQKLYTLYVIGLGSYLILKKKEDTSLAKLLQKRMHPVHWKISQEMANDQNALDPEHLERRVPSFNYQVYDFIGPAEYK